MERHAWGKDFTAKAMVSQKPSGTYRWKSILVLPIHAFLATTLKLRRSIRKLYSHASLGSQLATRLPKSVVVLGQVFVDGTAAVEIGEDCYLYPDLHLETGDTATIRIGAGVVISRGTHLVAMSGITIGAGTMIGEYTSIRDANHQRSANATLRNAGHSAHPIVIGSEVWIGRGVTVLAASRLAMAPRSEPMQLSRGMFCRIQLSLAFPRSRFRQDHTRTASQFSERLPRWIVAALIV